MHSNLDGSDTLAQEIARVNQLTWSMLEEYVSWSSKISYGETYYVLYGDMLDFVNFRMETADSCLLMIERRKIADSLGLSRSLLEHYLLLMLMCRGRKCFRLQDLSALSEADFKARFEKQDAELRGLQAQAKTQCLAVKKYPRAKRHLMYVFEGLRSNDESDFVIPAHFFHFQEFNPEIMRLKDEDYFQYYQPESEAKRRDRDYQQELVFRYRHYLSYGALLQCLELNDLVDSATIARIEAHYTFLGKFLHPTHNAARDLHEHSNVHSGKTAIGMDHEYSTVAVLLAALYVCYKVAGLVDEVAGLIENAPSKYVKQAGTDALRGLTARVATDFPYFWFLFNDPPLYDRYNYCSHHASDEELAAWGHYSNVPKERVPFDQHIYSHLEHALGGWSNARCGVYRSPIS
jgi:hypothetical protein